MTSLFKNLFQRNKNELKLDFIGDVHGYADELEALLEKLGYKLVNNIWQHTEFKAVFVGDFINRGPQNRRTLELIRRMVKHGAAYAILGNHEINVICYFTKRKNGKSIRFPSLASRRFLDKIRWEYSDDIEAFDKRIKWLRKLPLYCDFGKVRAVHAYWSDQNLKLISEGMPEGKLTKSFLKEAMSGLGSISKAFYQTTKGVEYCFPPNMIVKDVNKARKISFRVRWWLNPKGMTYQALKYESKNQLPDIPIPDNLTFPYEIYPADAPPVFIGHYCMNNGDMIPQPNICCIDACVGNGGRLAAYRWQGESILTNDHIIYVEKA